MWPTSVAVLQSKIVWPTYVDTWFGLFYTSKRSLTNKVKYLFGSFNWTSSDIIKNSKKFINILFRHQKVFLGACEVLSLRYTWEVVWKAQTCHKRKTYPQKVDKKLASGSETFLLDEEQKKNMPFNSKVFLYIYCYNKMQLWIIVLTKE